jgi:5'-nucleotidase
MGIPLILITNDDGIHAPGLRALIKTARDYGKVVVVAPDKPQSGMSHAVTTSSPLRYRKLQKQENYEEYSCNGTPADSVKMGEKVILDRKPDLLLSGINHGSNAGINLLYSGTMAAAIEAAMGGVPAIGFSLLSHAYDADFGPSETYIRKIIEEVLANGMAPYTCLNVNIPSKAAGEINGIKVCRMGRGYWEEELEERIDPNNRPYFWLEGAFKSLDAGEDTDEWALQNDFVSVVPIQLDLTSHSSIPVLKNLENHV